MLYYRNLKPALPRTIMIEPTNACNLKCFMCDYQKQFKGGRSSLSLERFESILTQFPKIEGLIFCGLGEPLLNKDILEMVSIASKRKIPFINLITNGVLLGAKCFSELIKFGLTRIQISFHSVNPEIAEKINGSSYEAHSLVRENILNAVKIRDSSCCGVYIVLNSVMNIENSGDLLNLIDFCETNGIDEINFIQLTTVFGKYDSFNIVRDKARSLIRQIKARLKKSKLKANFLSGSSSGRCYQLWDFIMIHADGNISPCNGIMPHQNIKIGNLIHENISGIWHSDKYIRLRRSVIEKNLQNCKYCEVGHPFEGKNLEWFNNYYLKPLVRNMYFYIRNERN